MVLLDELGHQAGAAAALEREQEEEAPAAVVAVTGSRQFDGRRRLAECGNRGGGLL